MGTLWEFLDVDYANSRDDRHSTAGYRVFLRDSLVSQSSKKQKLRTNPKLYKNTKFPKKPKL